MEFINEVNTKIETYVENGLDVRFEEDETAYANVSRYDPLVAGTYMPLPKKFRRDNEYLKWPLRALLLPATKGKNTLRTTSYPTDDEMPVNHLAKWTNGSKTIKKIVRIVSNHCFFATK